MKTRNTQYRNRDEIVDFPPYGQFLHGVQVIRNAQFASYEDQEAFVKHPSTTHFYVDSYENACYIHKTGAVPIKVRYQDRNVTMVRVEDPDGFNSRLVSERLLAEV